MTEARNEPEPCPRCEHTLAVARRAAEQTQRSQQQFDRLSQAFDGLLDSHKRLAQSHRELERISEEALDGSDRLVLLVWALLAARRR